MITTSGYDVYASSGLYDEYMYRIAGAQTIAEVEAIYDETITAETKLDLLDLDRSRLNFIASISSRAITAREEAKCLLGMIR